MNRSSSAADNRLQRSASHSRAGSPATSRAVTKDSPLPESLPMSRAASKEMMLTQKNSRKLRAARHQQAMQFEEMFQQAYKRAAKRNAYDRKSTGASCGNIHSFIMSQTGMRNSASTMSMEDILTQRLRNQEEAQWAWKVLSNPMEDPADDEPGKVSPSNAQGDMDRHSFTTSSQGRASDKSSAVHRQQEAAEANAVRRRSFTAVTGDMSPVSAMLSRPDSPDSGKLQRTGTGIRPESPKELQAEEIDNGANEDLSVPDEIELQEILSPPDTEGMLARFKAETVRNGFQPPEMERMRQAFHRFQAVGSNDIDIDDLEKVLVHLGYLKIDLKVVLEMASRLTKFSSLDFDEFSKFMDNYVMFEREEVRTAFNQFDLDGSGSLDTDEVEGVMNSLGIFIFKSQMAAAIAIVDEDKTGTLDFEEFIHLMTAYRKTEGFSEQEVVALYKTFYKFADDPKDGSGLREVPIERLREALMFMFGPQGASLAAKLANEVMKKMQQRKEEKDARRALLRMPPPEEEETQGMKFREFLVWARKLREAEIAEYRREFKKADPDLSGKLDCDEIAVVIKNLGYTPLRSVVLDMLEEFDTDKEGQLDFDEFVNMMEVFRRTDGFNRENVTEMQDTFKLFDPKCLGEVGVLQVAAILRYMGYNVELEQAESYVKAVDFNGSDSLDFREFLRLMRLHREERLALLKDVFFKCCDPATLRLSQSGVKDALNKLGHKISGTMLGAFLSGMEDSKSLDLDGFVQVADGCRKFIIRKTRKQASFLDEEVETFAHAFRKYDVDNSGDISRKEMNALITDLQIEMKTVDDQQFYINLLEESRQSALKGGVSQEEVGDKDTGITFWTFVHFLRQCQTQEDMKKVRNMNVNGNNFSKDQLEELQFVFGGWLEKAAKKAGFINNDEDDDPNSSGSDLNESSDDEVEVNPKDKLLPMKMLWKLLHRLGVSLTPTHKEQLKGKIGLDPESNIPADLRRTAIDHDGFIRLLTWMLDSNFANLRSVVEARQRPPAADGFPSSEVSDGRNAAVMRGRPSILAGRM